MKQKVDIVINTDLYFIINKLLSSLDPRLSSLDYFTNTFFTVPSLMRMMLMPG